MGDMRPQVKRGDAYFGRSERQDRENTYRTLIRGLLNIKVFTNVVIITGRSHPDRPRVGYVSEHGAEEHNCLDAVGEGKVDHGGGKPCPHHH